MQVRKHFGSRSNVFRQINATVMPVTPRLMMRRGTQAMVTPISMCASKIEVVRLNIFWTSIFLCVISGVQQLRNPEGI